MNAERLKGFLEQVRRELDVTNVGDRLQKLETGLEEQAGQPGTVSVEAQVAEAINGLRSDLRNAPSEEYGEVWCHTAKELGLAGVLAPAIEQRVDAILSENQLTPTVAVRELKSLRESVARTRTTIDQTVRGLERFGIRATPIPPNMGEVGVLIPRSAVNNNLREFAIETEELNQILNTVAEAVTGNVEDIQIESISSSEILIYVWVGSSVAKALATTLAVLVAGYRDISEVREVRDKLKGRGLTPQQLSGLDEYARQQMGKVIDAAVEETLAENGKKDARGIELHTLFKNALWSIAERLDGGYNFDVRASDLAESQGDEAQREAAQAITGVRKALQFMKVGGDRILQVPATNVAVHREAVSAVSQGGWSWNRSKKGA
jgi:hypothetical protein